MVVDDEEKLAYLFMKLLKGSGFNFVSFTDPLQTIEHIKQNPERNGLQLAKK